MTLHVSSTAAKKLLSEESTGASACFYAVEALLGEQWFLWEPATTWIELKHNGVEVPEGNRTQIMAARNLLTSGRFWYDANVYEKVCTAFNFENINEDSLEDIPVAYLNWGIYEAKEIYNHYEINADILLDREPIEYTAVQLFREGFVLAPEHLQWAQDALDKYYPKECKALRDDIREAWAAAPRNLDKLRDAAYPETSAGVQLAKLAAVHLYFEKRKAAYLKDMAALQA